MKKVSLLLAGLLCMTVLVHAGEVITNDTGADATGLRVTFSNPVLITDFGDILTSVDPQMLAFEFVFSGGVVEPWGSHWMNWAPATASVVEVEWMTGAFPTSTSQSKGQSREALLNLGRAPTYEEIMSAIAEYPGADEPTYLPSADEPIWLTDLEGHADIYDNDSIKINYADWFDQSQITKIEVYRNGIKLRFVPNKIDVLTNEQMKSFDGNPLEMTPPSGHYDHAIFGYQFQFRLSQAGTSSQVLLEKMIESPIHFAGKRLAFPAHSFFEYTNYMSDSEILITMASWASLGFTDIQIYVSLYTSAQTSNVVFAQYTPDPTICTQWWRTATDAELRRILSLAETAGLDSQLTLQIWHTLEHGKNAASDLNPQDVGEWFSQYTELCVQYARLAQSVGVEVISVGCELNSMQRYVAEWEKLVGSVRQTFKGLVSFTEATHHYLRGLSIFPSELWQQKELRRFWDCFDVIGMNSWGFTLAETADPTLQTLATNFVAPWLEMVAYYRETYPGKQLWLSEVGPCNLDGSNAMTGEEYWSGCGDKSTANYDSQEDADAWSAFIIGADLLDVDAMPIWAMELQGDHQDRWFVNTTPALRCITSLFSSPGEETAAGHIESTDSPVFRLSVDDPTYDEIMSAIAEYPGADEPLYEPASDEAVWLTDLEGHADIYDNDSIRINYADWFDQSQITKIEVYRNSIKLRFVPDKIDVLTNELMKTFDGNPAERTPASNHDDHSIWGYEFEFRVSHASGALSRGIRVLNPIPSSFDSPYAFIGASWDLAMTTWDRPTNAEILLMLKDLKEAGFRGLSVNVNIYVKSTRSSEVVTLSAPDGIISTWTKTASDGEIRRLAGLASQVDLDLEIRLQLIVSDSWTKLHGGYGGSVDPENLNAFFQSYSDTATHYAMIAEEVGAVLFTPFTEMDSMERHTSRVEAILDRLGTVFSGQISFEESTNHYLDGFNGYSYESNTPFEENVGKFWDWQPPGADPLVVEWSCWSPTLETQADQRLSVLVEHMYSFWEPALRYYRANHPRCSIRFGEIGVYNTDGVCLGNDHYWEIRNRSTSVEFGEIDEQEVADIWAAYLIVSTAMGLDGFSAWDIGFSRDWQSTLEARAGCCADFGQNSNDFSPPLAVIASFLGGVWWPNSQLLQPETDQEPELDPRTTVFNASYYAHPASVMQGASDRDGIFAMPLNGIPELGFYPVSDPDLLPLLTWFAESSIPEGFGVEIEKDTLYIWGASPTWSGRGEVTLTAEDPYGNQASITIPVTVFETDRTFVNEEGVTEYYIPWDPQLDINRIQSTDAHALQKHTTTSGLDRSVNWSHWQLLGEMNAVNCGGRWLNDSSISGWTTESQRKMVDLAFDELERLNVDWIKIDPFYYMWNLTDTEILAIQDEPHLGPSWTDDDIRYVIAEAHSRGIKVMGSLQLWPLNNGSFFGPGRQLMRPTNWDSWLNSYEDLVGGLASLWYECGAEAVCPGVELFNLNYELRGERYITDSKWNASMTEVVTEVRKSYSGPVTWALTVLPIILHEDDAYTRMLPLLEKLDILGFNAYYFPLGSGAGTTLGEVTQDLDSYFSRLVDPIVETLRKPFVLTEVGGNSSEGMLSAGALKTGGATLKGLEEQALLYQAVIDVVSQREAFRGAFWWEYSLNSAAPSAAKGGYLDEEATFRLKPAEQVISAEYGAESFGVCQLDGDMSEWGVGNLLATDEVAGAQQAGGDIASVHVMSDAWYHYLAVTFHGELSKGKNLHIHLDFDADGTIDTPISIESGKMLGTIWSDMNWARPSTFVDVAPSRDGTGYELRLPVKLLIDLPTSFRIETWDVSRRVLVDELLITQDHDEVPAQMTIGEPAREINNLGSIPQAIEVVNGIAYVIDWNSGLLRSVDSIAGEIFGVAEDFAHVTDIASDGDDLILVSEEGAAWRFSTETEVSTKLDLGASANGEVLGVAHEDDTLYLLVYSPAGPSILTIQDGQSTQTPIQVGSAGELISLQLWNGSLLTLDYAAGIGYRLVEIDDSYTLELAFNITDYVPANEQASGGVRGFFLTEDTYYFTSMSQDSNPGKLHIVPVAPDPLAISLQDWILTDFGANSGVLDSLAFGEDDHGTYLSFTNPSSELNVVLQLWSDSNEHDLSSVTSFFLDAVCLGESTDLFVEFIHDDASYSESAIFASNEEDPLTLTESGGLTILPEDLSISAGTSFPWDDVDGLMLHFRPSGAEIRFYEFRAAIQAALKELEK